ncbi:hypothetical protein M1N91_02710 [Dehalococcoidia bacterium]|nr:hypothetical protein [Dehalococcoidia bacterium]
MGFVFIGLSLCLTNIQTAISKVEAKLAGVDIEELSFASIIVDKKRGWGS